MNERVHHRFGWRLLKFLRHDEAVRALVARFFLLLRRPRPDTDTSIAWEDGEAENRSERRH